MAYLDTIFCPRCKEQKRVMRGAGRPAPTYCGDCQRAIDAEAEEKHFAELDALPLEERLRRVEKWIYHYQPRYVPPPRF
jgi:hypothetical protein